MKKLIVALLFPCTCFAQKTYDYKNLVLEGGGVRGLAYAGVFSVLEQKGILQQVENVGGSSAGSIAGMLVSIGYNAAEIDSLMRWNCLFKNLKMVTADWLVNTKD